MKKIKALIVTGYHIPGYKHGGIQTSILNTIEALSDQIDFKIITRNHDFGSNHIYENIKSNRWYDYVNSKVRYLNALEQKIQNLIKIIKNIDYDVIHLNSFFDPIIIKILLASKLNLFTSKKIIISPRGEFAWPSLKIRYYKKLIYIILFKLILYKDNIIWHVSTQNEAKDLIKVLNIKKNIIVARDLPTKKQSFSFKENFSKSFKKNELRIIFLSRISPEKNLDFAIKIINKINYMIVFDIYGTIHDKVYWNKCLELIDRSPDNIQISFRGSVEPKKVTEIFNNYDLFFFPTKGENYGHVIAESLSVGTPVLISEDTPWRKLEFSGFGWDFPIKDENIFINKIEEICHMSQDELSKQRRSILKNIDKVLFQDKDIKDNFLIYKNQ